MWLTRFYLRKLQIFPSFLFVLCDLLFTSAANTNKSKVNYSDRKMIQQQAFEFNLVTKKHVWTDQTAESELDNFQFVK